MKERLLHFWKSFIEHVYAPSQEVTVPIKTLSLSKKANEAHGVAEWLTLAFILLRFCGLVAFPIACLYILFDCGVIPKLWHGVVLTLEELIFCECILYLAAFVMLFSRPFKYRIGDSCVMCMREARNNPQIKRLLQQYKWWYVTADAMVFTNRRARYGLASYLVFPCSYDYNQNYKRDIFTWFCDYVIWGLYIRVMWPYFFNPVQLSFLEYDEAAKTANLSQGEKVLVLGAGAVPHHVRWKKRLGANGEITALDMDKYALGDSKRIEVALEWLRSLFGKKRFLTKYVHANALELPFADSEFDAVIAIRCYDVSIPEALRVLRPGGRVVTSMCLGYVEYPKTKTSYTEQLAPYNGYMFTKLPQTI